MRIGHLTTSDMSLALLLSTELVVDHEAGHQVFAISAPGPYRQRVEETGAHFVAIDALTRSWKPLHDLAAFGQLLRALRTLRLDVLHTHNPKTGVLGRIAGRLAGIPVVVNTCHGLWLKPGDSRVKRAVVLGLEALAIRFSDFELFQNAEDEATLRPFLKRGRHRVVGNGIDLDRFQRDPQAGRRFRDQLGLPPDALVVGTVGRRVPEKGLVEFLALAEALKDRAHFIWVGPPESDHPTPASDQVAFVDEQVDMPAVYSAMDVFVLASHREGFSRASMEAAACATPMVLSDIRGCREIGRDGREVLLVPSGDVAALVRRVTVLADTPDARVNLARAARERALSYFNQRRVARASLAAYASVQARKRRPAR